MVQILLVVNRRVKPMRIDVSDLRYLKYISNIDH